MFPPGSHQADDETAANRITGPCSGARVHGRCLEDQAMLQASEAVRRLVGACRILDATTAGDFLPRFKTAPQVAQLSEVIDDIEEAVGIAEIFSVELGQGLRADVHCDRIFERNGKRTGLFFQRLEPEIKRVLEEKVKIKVVDLALPILPHKEIMVRVLTELREPAAYREHRFSASVSKDRLNISAWGFLLANRGVFVTEREIFRSRCIASSLKRTWG
jgi:hypothetical protein